MLKPLLMLTAALILAARSGSTPIDLKALDELVRARDVAKIAKYVRGEAPLGILRTNGAYEGGKYGWRALGLSAPNGQRYVVLSTPITGEDVGELLFVEENGALRYIPETETFGMRVTHEDLTAEFDLPKSAVRLSARVALEPTATATSTGKVGGRGFILRLGPNYTLTSLVGPNGKKVPFVQAGGIVWVDALHQASRLTMAYSGVVNKPQYAGSIDTGHIQLSNEFWYPSIARLPATYTLTATIPDGWTAVGQGEPILREGKTLFDMRLPTSVWSFSAEPFKTFSRKDKNGRGYDVYSQSLTEPEMRLQTELNETILNFYEQSFAPYPFRRWGAADVKTYGGGALEAYNFATYGGGFLPDEDAHEPSHTWWGGILPNTYLHSFWNESFAVWSEGFFRRNVPIGDVAARRDAFADRALDQAEYAIAPVGSASCFVGPAASELGYGKGAHVLAMLEQLVGTDAMLVGCREWIKVHKPGEAADWPEFEATMTRLYPQMHLESFFNDWLRKTGAANVEVKSLAWKDGRLVGQMSPNSWRMPLEFVLVSKTGQVERRTFDTRNVAADGGFSLPSGFGKPARVLFDPYHRALRQGDASPATGFFDRTRGFKVVRDPETPDYLTVRGTKLAAVPADLDKTILVGHPRTMPALVPLLAKADMTVTGDTLSWRGVSVDLKRAGAVALVDLGDGKRCGIVLGTAALMPNVGRAATALFDPYARFLTGATPLPEPKDGVFVIE